MTFAGTFLESKEGKFWPIFSLLPGFSACKKVYKGLFYNSFILGLRCQRKKQKIIGFFGGKLLTVLDQWQDLVSVRGKVPGCGWCWDQWNPLQFLYSILQHLTQWVFIWTWSNFGEGKHESRWSIKTVLCWCWQQHILLALSELRIWSRLCYHVSSLKKRQWLLAIQSVLRSVWVCRQQNYFPLSFLPVAIS